MTLLSSDYQASTLPQDYQGKGHYDFFYKYSNLQFSFENGARESAPNAARYFSIGAKNTIAYELGLLCLSLLWGRPKEDCAVSSAELVLGSPLVLPGRFLSSPEPPAEDFLDHTQDGPSHLPTRHPPATAELPAALFATPWVYVRRGGALPPLALPHAGPHVVLERGPGGPAA